MDIFHFCFHDRVGNNHQAIITRHPDRRGQSELLGNPASGVLFEIAHKITKLISVNGQNQVYVARHEHIRGQYGIVLRQTKFQRLTKSFGKSGNSAKVLPVLEGRGDIEPRAMPLIRISKSHVYCAAPSGPLSRIRSALLPRNRWRESRPDGTTCSVLSNHPLT